MYFNFFPIPPIPSNCDKPPTIYTILNSIVNGDKDDEDEYVKIKNLAKEGRHVIFDFDYDLSDAITKEKFETMILNHYMTRRIGFQTVTNFKLHLNVKINSIIQKYNNMFDSLNEYNLMDGEITTRQGTDNSQTNQNSTNGNTTNSTNDNRFSDTPQNELQAVRDGKYVTDYSYTQNNTESSGTDESEGTSTREYDETVKHSNVIDNYLKIQNDLDNIFDMIFKDLDCLFYSLI